MEFNQELKKYQDIINNELERAIKKDECPEEMLIESARYSLLAGGKRLRPILMIKAYEIFKSEIKECMPFAVAMEMIHNFSLIHDDMPCIDNDDFRHGKPTNHKKFNESTALLAGDKLLNNAYIVISNELKKKDNLENKIKCFNELSIAVDRMIAGEYVDTEFEGKEISNDYLEYMHKNKTGALIKASIRIGAILGNAEEKYLQKLTQYAEIIGLTFQIKDDILSVIGDEEKLGKPVGNDEKSHKATYVTKYGLQEAIKILNEKTEKAIELANEFGETGEFFKELAIFIKEREK